jgi:membrane protease YdiL (CAAX protease family)
MQLILNKLRLWGLLLVSFLIFGLYLQYRESIFQVPSPEYQLSEPPGREEIQKLIYPLMDLSSSSFTYTLDTFVDRNTVKFLQQTLTQDEFVNILANENLPLWGWEIHVQKPVQAKLIVSQRRQLVGFEILEAPKFFKPFSDPSKTWAILKSKTGKDLSKARREVPGTQLIETITVKLDQGTVQSFQSKLLLPVSYASAINQTVEKQKTLHQVFNVFHYLLIALIFLFLFRAYENKKLSWRKNAYVFLVLFLTQLITFFLKSESQESLLLTFLLTLIKTIGHTTWMFALIVSADFIARVYPKSKYTLSDIFNRSFFASHSFRESLIFGWVLFVVQVVVVGLFYKVYQSFSAYVPLKIPGEHSTQNLFEFLRYFSESLSTSIYEEVLYRLFLICFFAVILKRAWPAVILSSILWGFLHFSYQFEPYYVRGVELTLVGLIYGWTMLRYGILSVILAHFFYNSFVISEYEYQFAYYTTGIVAFSGLILFMSHLYHRKHPLFIFERAEFPLAPKQNSPLSERRNILRKIYPMNWKYGLVSLLVLVFILSRIPFGSQSMPQINNQELVQISTNFSKAYTQEETWSVTYLQKNQEIQKLYSDIKKSDFQKEIVKKLEPYSHLWSIRVFVKNQSHIVCDMDYSQAYELLKMHCPLQSAYIQHSFDDWIRLVKDPKETWTLFNLDKVNDREVLYQYNVVESEINHVTKNVFLRFQNGQLISMEKKIGIGFIKNQSPQEAPNEKHYVSIFLSLVAASIFIGFCRFFFLSGSRITFHDKKSWIAVSISCFLYVLWKLNSYKDALIDFDQTLTLGHFILNDVLFTSIKLLAVAAITYLLFYGFFHFPSLVFKHAATSSEWNGILSRPIWKWRNTRVSLLYAALLLCIQTLLRLLVQINNGIPSLDLFHFDISFLNHEYLFITFVGLVWKNLLFWCGLMIVITIFEKYFPRWTYLLILSSIALINILMSNSPLDSKLIEICSIYIVFYFIYNVARFDFSFYFWFILMNTLTSFVPLLIFRQYGSYFYQVIFIFIFVFTMILYTLLRARSLRAVTS